MNPRAGRLLVALCVAGIALAPVHPSAEPRPGTVVGLDLATPEAAVESFVTAWDRGDYFVAYLVLDPIMRVRFVRALEIFNYVQVLGSRPGQAFDDRFVVHLAEDAASADTPGWSVDNFAQFEATLRAGVDAGIALPRFDPSGLGEPVAVPFPGPAALHARVALPTAAGGGVLVLRRSPEGRWRLVGIEKRQLPEFWHYVPEGG